MTTTQPIPTNAFFNNASTTPTPTQPQTNPGFLNNLWRGTQSFVYSPARHATEEAAQGLANRLSELFSANQPEITNRVRDVFTNSLIRRTPDNYCQLRHHIQSFLRNPSKTDLDVIKQLLPTINDVGIRALSPSINQTGVDALTTLNTLLNREITENPRVDTSHPITLTVNPVATLALQTAEAILGTIIENYEGALIQTLNVLTQSLNAQDGPIASLRLQLNHPQTGVFSESLQVLRRQLNARAHPHLRECKEAIDSYRSALRRQAAPQEITMLMQSLRTKFNLLNTQRTLFPQITIDKWPDLERFDLDLQTAISTPNALPPHAQLLTQSDSPCDILTSAFNAQRGMVEEAADILVEGIGRGVEHLVPLPNRMLQNFISPTLPTQSGATTTLPPPTTPTVNATLNIGNLTAQARSFLDSVLSSSGGALSQIAAQSLATLFRYTFQKIREHVQRDSTQGHLLTTIDPMIQRLQGAIDRSSWDELRAVLQDALTFMQQQQVYLQGLRLPLNPVRTHVSAIPNFLNNINAHQNALQPPSHRNPQTVTEAMISAQSAILKARSSSYGPARLIVEKVLGLEAGPGFYAEIYNSPNVLNTANLPAYFREKLFAKLDSSKTHFVTKWIGKRLYDLLHPLSAFYIHSSIDKALTQITDWIHRPPSSLESKDEMIIKLVRNWMAVTSGAYNEVANTPASQTKDFSAMMEDALKLPARNAGLSQQELYSAVAKTALDTFGPRIQWSQTIDHYFSSEIPADSPLYFLNPVAKGLNIFCSFCLNAIIFLPQWIGNQVLQTSAKIALSHSLFFKEYSEQSIESLRRNTPSSYAVQRMIFRQQQKILSLLQKNLSEEASGSPSLLTRSTNSKKVEIGGLIDYSLEILNKSQYRTQDRLRNYLNNQAPIRDRVGRELEETFLPELMETAITTISITMKEVTEEGEMMQMLYDSLQIANDAFDAKEPVSDAEFAAIEKGIRELTDQILETALFHAIGEKFDFTNEKQKRGITQFITTLKSQTGQFSSSLNMYASQIASRAYLPAPNLVQKVTSMVEASAKFNKQRLDALGAADGNRYFHTETKYHMNELSRQLLTHCTPLSNRLNEMKSLADAMLNLDHLLSPLLLNNQTLRRINEKLQNQPQTFEDLPFLKTQLFQLQTSLATLRTYQCPIPLYDELERQTREFSILVEKLENLQKTESLLPQAQTLMTQLYLEKIGRIGSPPTPRLKNLEKQLCDLLQQLPIPEHRAQLNTSVLALMLSQNRQEADTAKASFLSTHIQISGTINNTSMWYFVSLKHTHDAMKLRTDQSIQEFSQSYAQNLRSVQNHASEVTTEVRALDRWAQSQHDLAIWNLFVFDMQWVSEMVKNLAFDRAKSKVDQLFDALYQRHNYIGFVNQVALLPFLDKFGKHHLKTPS